MTFAKKPTAVEFWQTRFCSQVPRAQTTIPSTLAGALHRAAQRRAADADPLKVEEAKRLMLAMAIERLLAQLGEPLGVDVATIARSEARAGETPFVLLTPEQAAASQEQRRRERQLSELEYERKKAKGKLIELSARLATMKSIDVQPSDIELLAITAEEAGEALSTAIRDAGLREDHPAVKWYRQASRAAQEPATVK